MTLQLAMSKPSSAMEVATKRLIEPFLKRSSTSVCFLASIPSDFWSPSDLGFIPPKKKWDLILKPDEDDADELEEGGEVVELCNFEMLFMNFERRTATKRLWTNTTPRSSESS